MVSDPVVESNKDASGASSSITKLHAVAEWSRPTEPNPSSFPSQLGGPFPSVRDEAELPPEIADGAFPAECARGGTATHDPRERILALYDEYRPRLFRYMRSMHLDRESADEVIQETFMRLTVTLLRGAEIDNLGGWIVRVAHNLAVDVLKKQRVSVIYGEGATLAIENRVDTAAMSPEEAYANKEQAGRMQRALSTLKPQHRQCFQMRAQGLRYKEIGIALGISEQRAAFVVKQVAVRLAAICG